MKDDQYLISPLTGEKIPASKAAEHMKVNIFFPAFFYLSETTHFCCVYATCYKIYLMNF